MTTTSIQDSDIDFETIAFNLYDVLEVPAHSSLDVIKNAYKRQILRWHPDKQNSGNSCSVLEKAKFQEIKLAWGILGNEEQRREYDNFLQRKATAFGSAEEISISAFQQLGELYQHSCRCGEFYEITLEDLASGYNTVQCNGCSLFITVIEA